MVDRRGGDALVVNMGLESVATIVKRVVGSRKVSISFFANK